MSDLPTISSLWATFVSIFREEDSTPSASWWTLITPRRFDLPIPTLRLIRPADDYTSIVGLRRLLSRHSFAHPFVFISNLSLSIMFSRSFCTNHSSRVHASLLPLIAAIELLPAPGLDSLGLGSPDFGTSHLFSSLCSHRIPLPLECVIPPSPM